MNLKNLISQTFSSYPFYKSILGQRTDEIGYEKLIAYGIDSGCNPKLGKEDRRLIRERWGKVIPSSAIKRGYHFYEMTKSIANGTINSSYLPSAYYMPYVFEKLNPAFALNVLAHKSLQKIVFQGIAQPATLVCSMGGCLYDSAYRQITAVDACEILSASPFILKPANDSSMGRGVKLIDATDKAHLMELLDATHQDFIAQVPVSQSKKMMELNPTSLNCMRITTLNLNGNISATNMIVKIGAKGQIVDNIGSGSGGMMVGVKKDGTLKDFGCRVDGSVELILELGLSNFKIPNFDKVIECAVIAHGKAQLMGIVGWDIALDDNDSPVLIEGNSYWPGITIEQICSGPIFGERTDEVILHLSGH